MAHVEISDASVVEVKQTSPRRWLVRLDHILGTSVEIPDAVLVVAEIVVLFAGVVSRYVLHAPLIWSDELASMLFLWLAMLGAVVAFRRSEHMRMTALVAIAGPRMRAYLDLVAICAALAFLLLIVHPPDQHHQRCPRGQRQIAEDGKPEPEGDRHPGKDAEAGHADEEDDEVEIAERTQQGLGQPEHGDQHGNR